MAQNISSYLKNVGKSFGYAIGDAFESYNPVLSSLSKEAKETASSMYDSIKSFAFDPPSADEKSLKGQITDSASDIWKNFVDDFKSGNWYNKQRQSDMEDSLAKSLGFDMGDFDFGGDDWDFGDDDYSSEESLAVSENNSAKNIINNMDDIGFKVAEGVSTATIESANYIVSSSNQSSRALYSLNQRGFSQVTQTLLSVNDTIAAFAKIGEPLSAHMQNSSVFFTHATESLNKIQQSLDQIVKNTTPAPLSTSSSYKSITGTLESLLGGDGILDIDAFKNMIKTNFEDSKDLVNMALDFINKFKAEDGSYGKNISVLTMALPALVSKVLIPKVFQDSMKSFNESLKYTLSAGLVKARETSSSNLAVEFLKDLILPKDGYKSTINTSNYEKGQVAWDGYSRKALVEVIPTTLLKIYSAISGEPEMRYDYNSGKFITLSSIRRKVQEEKEKAAQEAGGNYRKDALRAVENMEGKTKEETEKIKKEVENYFYNSFIRGREFFNINKDNFNAEDFGLGEESLKILRNLLKEYEKSNDIEKRSTGNRFVTDIALRRDEFGNTKRRRETSGIDNEIYLNNGFADEITGDRLQPNSRFALDEYNHSSNFYLQGIYQYTGYLADNIDYIGGRSKKAKKRKGISRDNKIQDIANPVEDRSSKKKGEKTREESNSSRIENLTEAINPIIDEDLNREEQRERLSEDLQEEINNRKKTTKEKIREIFSKFTPKNLMKFYERPFESLSGLLDSMTVSMNRLIWGKNGDEDDESGVMGYIMTHTKSAFEKFNKFVDDTFHIDIKEKVTKFWEMLFGEKGEDGKRHGGRLGQFRDDTFGELRNVGQWASGSVGDVILGRRIDNEDAPVVDSAAYGRKVTKTGIVAVSEGELIIPSELNPFYHGVTNKRNQVRKENEAIRKFYGAFNEGGTVGENDSGAEGATTRAQRKEREGGVVNFFLSGISKLFTSVTDLIGKARDKGKDGETDKKEKNIISNITKKFLQEAGDNKGAMGAGALIGAGVSVLTGSVIGPLFGAAIGSAVGLTIRSKTIQKVLFGEEDENGDPEGGLLSENISKFIKKNVPSMAKGAVVGGIGGLFMGSPVLGALVGSTVGFISSSEKAKEYIFGSDEKPGVIPKELQDKIKKAAPNIAAGMLVGATIGPFGLVGNLMIGAGLGYVTTSEKFHNYMFGEDGEGGLAKIIKEKFINNIDEIFHNMGNALKAQGKNLFKSISAKIKDLLTKKARAARNGEDRSTLGRILNFGGNIVTGATNFVGNRLTGINSRLRARNLRRGYGVYDREQRRNMFASERVSARGGNNRGTFGQLDQMLANTNSAEELQQLQSTFEDLRDPSRVYRRTMNQAMGSLYSGLSGIDTRTSEKIGRLVQKGKYDKAIEIINGMNISPEEKNRYIESINQARTSITEASNVRGRNQQILRNMRDRYGIDLSRQGDLENAIDQVRYEMTNGRFSEEEVAKKKEETFRERITRIFRSIDVNVARLAGGQPADIDDLESAGSSINIVNEESNDNDEERTSAREIVQSSANTNQNEDDESQTTTVTDFLGGIHQYTRNSQGELTEVANDNETRESRSFIDKFKESITHIPLIGTAIGSVGGLIGKLTEKLIGTDDKPGLLDKIKGLLGGDDGPLSWLFTFLAGTKIGKITKSIASKITLKGVLTNVAVPALLAAGLFGVFDPLIAKITGGAYSDGDNSKKNIIYDKNTGNKIQVDENGNPITDENGMYLDENGNAVSKYNVNVRKGQADSFSDKLKENSVRGVLTGKASVASKVLGRTSIGKGLKSFASKAMDVVNTSQLDDITAMAARMNLSTTITDAFSSFTRALKTVPALRGLGSKIDDMGIALANKVTKTLGSQSAKSVASLASNAVVWIKIAFIIADFTSGYEDARSTFGIINEPTVGQKIVSGIMRALKNCIPIVGALIPDSIVIDIICDHIAPALGIDVEELKYQRQYAQDTVDNYNEQHGTDYSVKDYNKAVLKDYTWTERVGNMGKSTWLDVKNKFSDTKKGIEEKGFFGYVKESGSDLLGKMKQSYGEGGGGLFGAAEALGTALENILPGVYGEIAKKNIEIGNLARKGDLVEMWKVSLDDFVSDTSKGEAQVGIFSKIVGQIPLLLNKLMSTPIALVCKVLSPVTEKVNSFVSGAIEKIGNTVEPIVEGAKYLVSLPKTVSDDTEKLMYQDDSNLSDFMDISKYLQQDKSKTFNGLIAATVMTTKISTVGIMLIKSVGRRVGKLLGSVKDKVTNTLSSIGTDFTAIKSFADQGKTWEMFSYINDEDDTGNPIGKFRMISRFGTSLLLTPYALLKHTGYLVGGIFNKAKEKVTNTFNEFVSNSAKINAYASAGDISGMFSAATSAEDEEGNPVGKIMKGALVANATVMVPLALMSKVGNAVGDFFKPKYDAIVSNFAILNATGDKLKNMVNDGKSSISDILNTTAEFDKNDMFGKFFSVGFTLQKAFFAISKILGVLLNPVKDIVDNVVNGVKEIGGNAVDGAKNLASNAKDFVYDIGNNAFQGIKDFITGGGSEISNNSFVSQFDSKYKDMKFGDSTVAEKGCAPAVATMVANNYGKSFTMDEAIKLSSGYQNKDGTTADYFKNVLNSRGISTNYLSGNNIPQQVMQSLANGDQVILLGKDANNTSKKVSPFGPSGHYVVATGIDANGNIIVSDPESNAPQKYSSSILNNANIGISTNASGGGAEQYDTDIARKVWGYFTSHGYTPAATAGIMGNLYQESGMNPARFQDNGPAAGIAQWENYKTKSSRWAQLNEFANQMGYQWNELTPQLAFIDKEVNGLDYWFQKNTDYPNNGAFKQETDPMRATLGFEKAFERAGKPNMENRYKATEAYYQLYQDSAYTGNYTPDSPGTGVTADTPTATNDSSTGITDILGAISTAFSKIGNIFSVGGYKEDSSANVSTSTGSTTSSSINLGPVPQGKGNAAQLKIVQYANSILGKNEYSQDANLRTKVEEGYSDCSSFAQWAYKKALGVDPGGNTGAIIDSPILTTVDKGSRPNINNLEAGDLLLFKSPTPNGRTENVGHVEIYDGNGNVIGHGSGQGPKKRSLDSYLSTRQNMGGPYIEARRYSDIAAVAGGSSGLLLSRRPGTKVYGTIENKTQFRSAKPIVNNYRHLSGGATDMAAQSTEMLNTIKNNVALQGSSGTISADLVQKLIQSIINVLNTIANNTAPVEKIYNVLSNYMSNSGNSTGTVQENTTTQPVVVNNNNSSKSSNSVDPNIYNLVGTLAEIANG